MRKVGLVMVGIVGSSHPIGAVLEVLPRAASFEARFREALVGFRLVVLCSASGSGEEAVTGLLATGMPVLELVWDGDEGGCSRESSVSWPYRVEVLEEWIRAALQPARPEAASRVTYTTGRGWERSGSMSRARWKLLGDLA